MELPHLLTRPETLMETSIPDAHWYMDASDPNALTRLLDLPDVRVTRLECLPDKQTLVLLCELTTHSGTCPTCGQTCPHPHAYTKRIVRDLPWGERACYLEMCLRRFDCVTCGLPFTEALPWLPAYARLTLRYQNTLFARCRHTSLRQVSREEHIGYKQLQRLYYAQAQAQSPYVPTATVSRLGIDEFALRKGHGHFAVAISDLETGAVVAILPDRKKETLLAYFATWTPPQRASVQQVALDLWETYSQVATECFAQARPVADRFHVMKNLNDSVSEARRALQRPLDAAAKKTLKGCRWLLVRNHADLNEDDKARLQAMFAVAPELGRLHALKEAFRTIFDTASSLEEAGVQLRAWIEAAQASALTPLQGFVNLLQKRWEHILNYFHTRLTSAGVEGLNNKIKVLKRLAYGFVNFEHFALRIRVECDGTP